MIEARTLIVDRVAADRERLLADSLQEVADRAAPRRKAKG